MTVTDSRCDERPRLDDWAGQYGAAVRGYILALVRNPHLAEDLAQEVFIRAWQGQARYQEQGQAKAWLFRIADHVVCDALRKRSVPTLGDQVWDLADSGSGADPAHRAAANETGSRLERALDLLSPIQRRVLLLRYFGELPFGDIAAAVDCPLNTVLSHCRRALELLRTEFADFTP